MNAIFAHAGSAGGGARAAAPAARTGRTGGGRAAAPAARPRPTRPR